MRISQEMKMKKGEEINKRRDWLKKQREIKNQFSENQSEKERQ